MTWKWVQTMFLPTHKRHVTLIHPVSTPASHQKAAMHLHKLARQAVRTAMWVAAALLSCQVSLAAPDEEAMGKSAGYPTAPKPGQSDQDPYMVGSFSAMDSINPHCILAPSSTPLPLPKASSETVFRYKFRGETLSIDDYMQHQRVTGLLILKDGKIVAERYNFKRTPEHRMLSESMAKTVVALAVGKALEEGRIRSLDDTAASYVPELAGTLYGQTKLVNLLRMASGAQFVHDQTPTDDRAKFSKLARAKGYVTALKSVTQRAAPEGEVFNYSNTQTVVLGLVLRAATGQSLCAYVDEKLWKPMGAESRATWLLNPADQFEQFAGGFNATVRDYARLGWLMARDGQRDDKSVVSSDWLLKMTDANLQPPAFRPGTMKHHGSTLQGYGFQTWLIAGPSRRFALEGVHAQSILIDPELKLVVVHTAVGKDASGDASGTHIGAERAALWRGIVNHYGTW
jgi:CubicO group peptidase (beta-lactamase class C family)